MGFIGDIVSMVVGLLWFMGYNASYSLAVSEVADNDKTWTLDAASAITVAGAIELDMTYASISQAAMHLELMANYEAGLPVRLPCSPRRREPLSRRRREKRTICSPSSSASEWLPQRRCWSTPLYKSKRLQLSD